MYFRKDPLKNGQYYHIYSRSIAKFVIFNNTDDYVRMLDILDLYRFKEFSYKYSRYKRLDDSAQRAVTIHLKDSPMLVKIISYCLMPTHLHLVLKQVTKDGISKYMARVLNSYSRYFNVSHQRTGPLWTGRFKNVLVKDNSQLLHLTRYIHLNPTSARIVKKPEKWHFSSYSEYIDSYQENGFCDFNGLFDFSPEKYKKFIDDRKSYQQEISQIKNILIDNYTG